MRLADQLRWQIPEEARSSEVVATIIGLNYTAMIEVSAFRAAIQGEHLNPDSCKFTIVGILDSSSPSETEVESG